MNESRYYTAVTIGPIGDTMNLITKPAALWASSYIFSFISRHICEKAAEAVGAKNIVSPFFPDKASPEESSLYDLLCKRDDGVGLFHDHIIALDNNKKFFNSFNDIKSAVIELVKAKFGISADYLNSYISISACNFSIPKNLTQNAIMYSSKMLDCMELSKVFSSSENKNELLAALSNAKVKDIGNNNLGIKDQNWQLLKDKNSIRDIPDICASAKADSFKKNNYYCLLRADGDNMSVLLSLLETDEQCRDFSQVCLEYCDKVAKIVGDFGGLTIYVGGDDLFALVPTETPDRRNVFDLINSINEIFDKKFDAYKQIIDKKNNENKKEIENGSCKKLAPPTLSFGAFICHKKHPLYEAVEKSGTLLFHVAKRTGGKNCVAIQLQKHSGQSEEMVISNASVEEVARKIRELETTPESFLLSAANKIIMFEKLINACDIKMTKNLFKNIFDAEYHINNSEEFLHSTLPDLFNNYCKNSSIVLYEKDVPQDNPAKTLGQLLRLIKFFVEADDSSKRTEKKGDK